MRHGLTNWGPLQRVLQGLRRLGAAPRPYLITDKSPVGTDSGTVSIWRRARRERGKISAIALNPSNSSRPHPTPHTPYLVSLCVSLSAPALLLLWWTFYALLNRMDSDTCFFFPFPRSRCCYLFHFPLLGSLIDEWRSVVRGWTDPQCRGAGRSHPSRTHQKTIQNAMGEGGFFLGCHSWRSSWTHIHKQAKQPKLTTKLTSNQTICSNFKDELLLELPVPFVTPGATMLLYFSVFNPFFYSFFCFTFCFQLFLLRA